MGFEVCFYNLISDDAFIMDFKSYVKSLYKSGNVPPGFPSSWQNANRQINRIIAFARNTGSQARSGKKALSEGGWLSVALNKFLEETFTKGAINCLRTMGVEGDKPVGHWEGLVPPEDIGKLGRENFRGTFDDWESLKNYGSQLMAVAPVGFVVACGRHAYVMPSL